jgi:uncharacterized protein (TIGR02677 family)
VAVPRLPAEMFRFAVGENAETYTAILDAFGEANERLETALSRDDVRSRLRSIGWFDALDDEALQAALGQLLSWQLLDVTQNHAQDYRTAQEYERHNLQFSLTRRGEAALAGLLAALSVLTSAGALQTAVLDAISDRLTELAQQLADPGSADRRIFTTLQELEGHLEALRNGTKAFNGELQRLLRVDGAEPGTFGEVKAATVSYLQEYLTNLDQRAFAIAAGLAAVERHGVAGLHRRALRGAELPTLSGVDPAPDWLAHRALRWAGLRAWFLPADGEPARVEQLHVVARRAIVSLLQVLDRITESRRRTSSAVADFRELARWFAQAPTDADLHRLWGAAFGLGSARHAHLLHPDPELIPSGTGWSQAPPVPVSALLRASGRTERFSRTARVRDVAAIRATRSARARAERAELEAAWDLLAGGGPVRLSSIGRLDVAVFERLLDLLGRALGGAVGPGGSRRAVTGDGRVEITLTPPADGLVATLRTARGDLTGPDYLVMIAPVAADGATVGTGPAVEAIR